MADGEGIAAHDESVHLAAHSDDSASESLEDVGRDQGLFELKITSRARTRFLWGLFADVRTSGCVDFSDIIVQ